MSNTENNGRNAKGQFQVGGSGGPGRPKGARNKLGEKMIEDMLTDWERHGIKAIEKMREERPHEYVRAFVSILPKEIKIEHIDEMTDEQISNRIRQLAAGLGISIGSLPGDGKASGSADAEARPDKTDPISRLH